MDFEAPRPVVDAVVARAKHGIYGYTDTSAELEDLTLRRLKTLYGSTETPDRSWLRWLPGLLPGLHHAVRAACQSREDRVVLLTPLYPPFLDAVERNGATLVQIPLIDSGASSIEIRFDLDWERLASALAHPATRLLHFCNPHNPAGRCWSRDDLERVARLCVESDVVICSDEVWGEMPLEPERAPFCSMLGLLPSDGGGGDVPGLRERLIFLTSPSKCFNVAGLDLAVAAVPHEPLRRRFCAGGSDAAEVTPFGYVAAAAAYGDAESELWRQRLLLYLRANRDFAFGALTQAEGVRATCPEASYLMWVQVPGLLTGTTAAAFFEEHGVGLTAAAEFGGGDDCVRLNFGTSRATLEEAVSRMLRALENL